MFSRSSHQLARFTPPPSFASPPPPPPPPTRSPLTRAAGVGGIADVKNMSSDEQQGLVDAQLDRQVILEVKAQWYDAGSKYSFTGPPPPLPFRCPLRPFPQALVSRFTPPPPLLPRFTSLLAAPVKSARDFE
jgi:hypothetical protein